MQRRLALLALIGVTVGCNSNHDDTCSFENPSPCPRDYPAYDASIANVLAEENPIPQFDRDASGDADAPSVGDAEDDGTDGAFDAASDVTAD
jgi:hypothetical protein